MRIILACVPLIMVLSGCLAVLGYEPTPAELEAIKRGEDPRANESRSSETGASQPQDPADAVEQPASAEQSPGPLRGTVLRWIDSATVVVEAEGAREVVALAGEATRESAFEEQTALDDRMNRWTYGSAVTLTYPVKDARGETVYRDSEGRLLAHIE